MAPGGTHLTWRIIGVVQVCDHGVIIPCPYCTAGIQAGQMPGGHVLQNVWANDAEGRTLLLDDGAFPKGHPLNDTTS